MEKTYQLLSFGEALIDFTPTPSDTYMPNVGGAPLNLAVCAAKYGCSAAFIGKVGKDAFGEMVEATAKNAGVSTAGLLWDEKHVTTHAFVTLAQDGDRSFIFCRNHGADVNICAEELPLQLIRQSSLFNFGGLSLSANPVKSACLAALNCAKESGACISFDPNYRPLLWESAAAFVRECNAVLPLVDVLKASLEEALMLADTSDEDKALAVLGATVPVVLLTKGAEGAVCCVNGEVELLPPYPANAVDTTGAGDIFFGSFLAAMLTNGCTPHTLTKAQAVSFGTASCRFAAKSTEKYGAIASIPNFLQEK